jgi:hypothetical protein
MGSGLDLLALLLQLLFITINYITAHNQWLLNTCSIPYWTMSVFSSLVTDLVLIYKSVTSSTSVVHWLTLHSWTLNRDWNLDLMTPVWLLRMTAVLRMLLELTNELFYNLRKTCKRPPPPTVCVLIRFICCHNNALTKLLSSNGLLHIYPLSCKGMSVL